MNIERTHYKYLLFILFASGLIVYSSSLSGPFVYDDKPFIADNPWIRSLSNFLDVSGTRYVCDLTFALNFFINGFNTFGYHLVNTFIHASNSILVFLMIISLFETPFMKGSQADNKRSPAVMVAFSSALLFLAHPAQIQAVSYISQRYTSLATFFYLLSAVFFLKARNLKESQNGGGKRGAAPFYLASLVSALLAMKTKEISFTLPFMLTLLDLSLFPSLRRGRRLIYLSPFFLAALLIPLSLIMPAGTSNAVEELMRANKLKEAMTISRYNYLLTQSAVVIAYLKLLLFPVDTGSIYHFPPASSFFEPGVFLSSSFIIILALLAASLLYRSVRERNGWGVLIALGIAWFFITVSVESSIIPIKDVFNERRVYLPSIGIIISAVASLSYGRELLKRRGVDLSPSLLTALFILTATMLGAVTFNRNRLWSDPLILYADEVRKNPYSHSPHMYLGIEYFERGKKAEALEQFKEAERISPSSVYVHKTLSKYYFNMGMHDEALKELDTVIALDPKNKEALYNIGVVYIKKGLFDEARAALDKVLAIYPEDDNTKKAIEHIRQKQADGN